MRRVRQLMGMPISIDIPDAKDQKPFEAAFNLLEAIGNRFSPYEPDSEVSRYRDSSRSGLVVSEDLKEIIEACKQAEKDTDGYFSAWAGSQFDPTGYIKGWAIAKAGQAIEERGYKTYCIGAGGDILARSDSDKIWRIGVQDPMDKSKILDLLSISNGAVATSGNYERGKHIINPKTKKPVSELLSITVTGPDIIRADIFATACFVMGTKAQDFLQNQTKYEFLIVDKNDRIIKSDRFNHNQENNR